MLDRVTRESLADWEVQLDDTNQVSYVPEAELSAVFEPNTLVSILGRKLVNSENISYLTSHSAFSIRYINDAYVWAGVLRAAGFNGGNVVELGPGTSRVVDMALAFLGFDGQLTKVDYSDWPEENKALKQSFSARTVPIDIAAHPEQVPVADVLVMNHFTDDIFIGLWARIAGVDYYANDFVSEDDNQTAWAQAIARASEIKPTIFNAFAVLAKRVRYGGLIAMKNYPSGFETHMRTVGRTNFTFALAEEISDMLVESGLQRVNIDLDAVPGAPGSKYPGAFAVFRRV